MATRTIVITKTEEVKRGQGKYGEWILSEVDATTEDGGRIEEKLQTFKADALPLNKPVEVEIEKRDPKPGYEKYGPTYTIKPIKDTPEMQKIRDLEDRLSKVEAKVFGAQEQPEEATETKTENKDGDLSDIPF